jgi:hypothetical protein
MDTRETKRLTETELHTLFDRLFPHGFSGADVLAEIAPQGWKHSPLLACFHPSVEQVFEERVTIPGARSEARGRERHADNSAERSVRFCRAVFRVPHRRSGSKATGTGLAQNMRFAFTDSAGTGWPFTLRRECPAESRQASRDPAGMEQPEEQVRLTKPGVRQTVGKRLATLVLARHRRQD